MKTIIAAAAFTTVAITYTGLCHAQHQLRFHERPDSKQIDLYDDETLLTTYNYSDSIKKPVLFPVNTASGVTVTRGFPLQPREGERIDHPHHVGMWLAYESVDGVDFWNHSTAIPVKDRPRYGTIIHDGIVKSDAADDHALLEVTARWVNHDNQILLREDTHYAFSVNEDDFIIDRSTTLTAWDRDILFKDVKDGLLGFRVTRELELPSTESISVLDKNLAPMPAAINNEDVSGDYLSSEGTTGKGVWGTRGRWMMLDGIINDQEVAIVILDHPKNPGYPTYWHARDYGLFAVNPLGQEVFSKGKQKLNLVVKKEQSVTFHYTVIIHTGAILTAPDIEKYVKTLVH